MKKKFFIFICGALLLSGGGIFAFFCFFQKSFKYDIRLPIIDFIPYTNEPLVEVVIEGMKYPLIIDLGVAQSLSLRCEILDKLHKEYRFMTEYMDVKGNEYETKVYHLDRMEIVDGLSVINFDVMEESSYFISEGSVIYKSDTKDAEADNAILGRIGRRVLTNINLFLDFDNNIMYACSQLSFKKREGYVIEKLVSASFQLDDILGIILQVETDLGIKKFILDTGATHNLIHPFLVQDQKCIEWKPGLPLYHSKKFAFGGKDFGETEFLVFDMAGGYKKVDGIIGMEFLKDHVVYLDFKQKIAYIGKASEVHPQVSEEALAGMR